MRDMRVLDKLIRLKKLKMTNNCALVKLRNVLSRQFDIKEGARQGDPLACVLLNISSEKAIRELKWKLRVQYLINQYKYWLVQTI
jgi:hypothetical protein